MERNKSDWYIERLVTNTTGFEGIYITKSIYEKRVDKKPEEVEGFKVARAMRVR